MSAPDWMERMLRAAFPARDGERGRRLARVAARLDHKTNTTASALQAISEKLRA